jgi:zinc transport system substrate-binding protein
LNRKIWLVLMVMVAVVILVGAYAYTTLSKENTWDQDDGKIGIMVSVGPQAEFAKAVGGDKVKVMVMVPPGADPHSYEPLPSQMEELSKARLYLAVGSSLNFELSYLDRIRSMNPQMKVVNTSAGITYIPSTEEGEGGNDPHVWVSPRNARIMVENIYQAMVQTDPQNQGYYQENRNQYLAQLDALDQNITSSLQNIKNHKILVYHPSWGYFCRDYGLEQVAIEQEGKEPSPQYLAQLVNGAKAEQIQVIFVSPQFSQKSAQTLATEIGARVVVVNPLAENYLENMRQVAEAFSQV